MSIAGFAIHGDVVVLGLVTGMVYGVLAAGLVLVYRSSRIINFAHGNIGAFGAALLGVSSRSWGVPYWLAFIFAIAGAAAVGALSEILVIRRLRQAPLVLTLIATLGLGQVVSIFASIVYGSVGAGIAYPQPAGFPRFSVGALLLTPAYTAELILTPVVIGVLVMFLRRGRLGIAMRASAANADAARMSGMAADRLSTLAWAIAGAVAAYTAILVLPTRGYSGGEFLGPGLLLRGLACAVVARMVNLPMTLLFGIVLGVIEQLLYANYPSGGQVEMAIFAIILVALLVQRSRTGRAEDKGTWASVQAFAPLPLSYLKVRSIRLLPKVAGALAAVLALVIPMLTTNATASTFTLIAAFAVVGMSLSLVTGLGGMLSLGQFAVAGVGATASYAVTSRGAPFIIGLVAGAAAAGGISLLIGLPAVRIRGLMLAVTTLGFGLAAQAWLFQRDWMLGTGVHPKRPAIGGFHFDTGKKYFLISFVVLLIAWYFARNVWVGGLGRRIRAVRDNEDAARAFTIPATQVKLQTFVFAGVIAGLGGAVYGHLLATISSSAFPVDANINVAAVAVIGGLGTLIGPVLGAFYIIGLPHFLPLDNAGLLATSAGWLFLILQAPGGAAQMFAPVRDRLIDTLARRAGLDPQTEREVTPGGGVGSAAGGLQGRTAPLRDIPHGNNLLEVEGVTKRFGGLIAVNDVSLDVRAGEILGLIGPNGAGKTTFFELLGGFTRADAGRISFEGSDVTGTRPEVRAKRGLIRSFQDAALFPTMTVHEVTMLALERRHPTRILPAVVGMGRLNDTRQSRRADELLATLGLMSYRDIKILALSTGTRRITEIACLIALEPTLLLLDEPTSGIAQRETEALGEVLRSVKEQLDLTLVIIEHDIPLIMGLADRVVAMESGAVIAAGTPAEVQADPKVISSYLGGDIRAIERSSRTPDQRARQADRGRCQGITKGGARCSLRAGTDGLCTHHRTAGAAV